MSKTQSCYIDNSHHETSYENYINRGYHASGQGIININHQHLRRDPLVELQKHCSPSAAFDSAARFDPPRCAESTRLRIIQIIEEWITSDECTVVPSSLFWLNGGAGVGKSALAQSLSEMFEGKRQLAGSFFFFRSDPTRNKGELLIPTLVSHLVRTFKGIEPLIEDSIRENPAVFTKRYETQIQELLIEPLLVLKSTGAVVANPQLIVIDGLDECENTDIQCELLRAIARALPQIPYPLRFLITSRPEAHITHVFSRDPYLQAIMVREYNLSDDPDADRDIRKFLEKEFVATREVHRLGQHLPDIWPDETTITSLVERSSGHFIYASTVIRYIRSPKHRPDNRLEVILRLRPPQEGDQPYAQLDALYALIFASVENHGQLESICLVLGILYFESRRAGFFSELIPERTAIEGLLKMEAGDLVLLLDPVLSLISVDGDEVRILHKSLFDYLLDFTRGGRLPFDLARVHGLAATYILKERIGKGVCHGHDFEHFAYHCQYAYLNDTLKDYLHSLEVPYPKPLTTVLDSSSGGRPSLFLQSALWFFFRTLGREDFDCTGQVSELYLAKWMDHLHSAASDSGRREPIGAVSILSRWLKQKLDKPLTELNTMDDLKRQLDTLLIEWKPQNFNPMDIGTGSVRRVALIKQLHRIQSISAKATCFGNKTVISSLLSGDYFIHGYHFGIPDEVSKSFLILQTFTKHGNASYGCMHMGVRLGDVVQKTRSYLTTVENYLFSDLCQKYGLEPDAATMIRYVQSFYSQGSETSCENLSIISM